MNVALSQALSYGACENVWVNACIACQMSQAKQKGKNIHLYVCI